MLILTIRTDKPEAEVALLDSDKKLVEEKWQAHRELSKTLHDKIAKNLQFVSKDWGDIEGIACYKGPGSFTGLRIGLSVANALAYDLNVPIVSQSGEDWQETAIQRLINKENETIALPEYDSEPYTTNPRK